MAEPAMATDWIAITSEELKVLRGRALRRGDEGALRRLQMQREDDEYAQFREAARERYKCAGKIEIDDGAVVSVSWDGGGGAYVAAWVYVSSEDAGLEEDPEEDSEDGPEGAST